MDEIKKILFLTPQLPYPPISGGVIKSWKLVEFLSKKYELSLANFLKNDEKSHLDTFLSKVKLEDYYYEPIDIPRTAANLIKSNLLLQPLNLYRNRSKTFKANIKKMIEASDAIFVDHYEMFQYVPKSYTGKIILHQHNCEYLIWHRYSILEKNLLKKIALKNQSFWIKKYEKKISQRSDTILAAPNDIEEFTKIGVKNEKFYETYHLGDEELLDLNPLKWSELEDAILFVGTLTWEANIDSVIYFIKDIWPLLLKQNENLKFYIVGKNPDRRIIQLSEKYDNIVITGFVTDLEDYYKKCKVFVSPLRFGSGIKVKVMNALYRGIPTVSTSIGAEGLAVKNEHSMMVSEDAEQLTRDILRLITEEDLWNTISKNSRQLARDLYTWDVVLEKVIQAIEE